MTRWWVRCILLLPYLNATVHTESRDEFITRVVTVTTRPLRSCGRLFIQTCDAVFSSCWRNAKLARTLAVNLSEVSQLKAQRPASLYIVWLTRDVALMLLLLLLLLLLWPVRVFRQTIRPTCSNFSRQVALQITRPRTVFLAHFHVFIETGLPVLSCTLCVALLLLLKTSQFKTACQDDSGYITQLKQQKSKRW